MNIFELIDDNDFKSLLFTFFDKAYPVINMIKKNIRKKEKDIWKMVFDKFKKEDDTSWRVSRADKRAKIRIDIIQGTGFNLDTLNNFVFLDYGAGEGDITNVFGKKLRETFSNCEIKGYGLDVEDWHGHSNLSKITPSSNLIKIIINPEKKLEDEVKFIPEKSLDFVILEMVLHHLPKEVRIQVYNLFHKLLKSNGVIFIREHNITNEKDRLLNDYTHHFYDYSKGNFNSVISTFYQSRERWIEEFSISGFSPVIITGEMKLEFQEHYPRVFMMAFRKK